MRNKLLIFFSLYFSALLVGSLIPSASSQQRIGGTRGTTINSTNNRLPKRQSSTAFTDSLLSDDGTNVTLTTGQFLAPTGGSGAPAYSFTSHPSVGLWDSGGVALLQNSSASQLAVSSSEVRLSSGLGFGFSSTTSATAAADTLLFRDAAGTLALRNSTSAQRWRVYNTRTDASNGEWFSVDWQTISNVAQVGTKANGTGTVRPMQLLMNTGTVLWLTGAGSPESVVTAGVGSLYTRTDGGAGTTLYVKESGSGNTGWIAK